MKTLTYILMFLVFVVGVLFTTDVLAAEYQVPKDAVIKVYTKDGKQIGEMSRSEYKVVKLGTSRQRVIVKEVHTDEYRKNRLTVRGGVGYDGLQVTQGNGQYSVTQDRNPVVGFGYARKLTKEFSLGVSAFSNQTYTLDFGFDF